MSYEHKPNTGSLFRNDRREKETHPEYKGEINIDGKLYELAAWVRTTKNDGKKFFSLSVSEKKPFDRRRVQDRETLDDVFNNREEEEELF